MSESYTALLDSENTDLQYRVTFLDSDTVEFLEVSHCSAKPRLWTQIDPRIAYDLQGFEDIKAGAEKYFENIDQDDDARLLAWDSARIERGIRGH